MKSKVQKLPANSLFFKIIIITIIIIIINCSWLVTRWQWLFYMCTRYEIFYIFIYLLQLGCYPVAVVTLHVNKT